MFINNFDPVAFSIYFIDIKWYSISYIAGILLGWIYIKKIIIKNNDINKVFDQLISNLIIGIILGGRLGYVLLYNLDYYLTNPLKIFYIWEGGMSFHGGMAGVIVATYLFSKKEKKETFFFLDLIACVAPIGIFFGRIANFINSELYGRETDILWSVKFIKIDNLPRHPSQIYEALFEGILLFIILNIIQKRYSYLRGIISALFLIIYSIFRFMIEFTREPDSQIGLIYFNLTMGQNVSILTFVAGLIIFYIKYEKK